LSACQSQVMQFWRIGGGGEMNGGFAGPHYRMQVTGSALGKF